MDIQYQLYSILFGRDQLKLLKIFELLSSVVQISDNIFKSHKLLNKNFRSRVRAAEMDVSYE